MGRDQGPGLAEKALSSAERHGRSLKAVNEKLADLVASLRDQKERLSVYSRSGAPTPAGVAEVRMDSRTTDKTLAAELALAREALEYREDDHARLRDRLAEIEAENRRLCDEFVAVQEQNVELVSLYAAIEQLHGAPTRTDLFTAIQEIVINVLGSEEFALYELAPDGRLHPVHAFGVDPATLGPLEVGGGRMGRAATDEGYHPPGDGGSPASRDGLTAWVPLRVGSEVAGALAIYSLLGHKPALTDFDRELFALLERHAALALRFRPRKRTGKAD